MSERELRSLASLQRSAIEAILEYARVNSGGKFTLNSVGEEWQMEFGNKKVNNDSPRGKNLIEVYVAATAKFEKERGEIAKRVNNTSGSAPTYLS